MYVELHKLTIQVDVELLQEVLENITYCDIEAEGWSLHSRAKHTLDLRYVDPNIVKLFQLSQLVIEYLLHSQEYLIINRQQLSDEKVAVQTKLASLSEQFEKMVNQSQNLMHEEPRIFYV